MEAGRLEEAAVQAATVVSLTEARFGAGSRELVNPLTNLGTVAFRRGDLGRLLRHHDRPAEGFHRFFHGFGGPALACLLNADRSRGPARLLFAINPTLQDATLSLDEAVLGPDPAAWRLLADQDRFYLGDAHGARRPLEASLWLPPLACALWAAR